jgi:hypothetical protein
VQQLNNAEDRSRDVNTELKLLTLGREECLYACT